MHIFGTDDRRDVLSIPSSITTNMDLIEFLSNEIHIAQRSTLDHFYGIYNWLNLLWSSADVKINSNDIRFCKDTLVYVLTINWNRIKTIQIHFS